MGLHPYREAFAARDLDRLLSLCTDDVVLHSPLIGEPGFEGRNAAAAIFGIVLRLLGDEQYTHDLGDERSHVFVADTKVRDEPMRLATLLELDADGKIADIWLMARPLKAMAALLEGIGRVLDAGAVDGGPVVYDLAKPLAGLAVATDRVAARLVDELNRSTV